MNNLSGILNNDAIQFGTHVMTFLCIDDVPNDWVFWIKLLLVIIVINNIWDMGKELLNIVSKDDKINMKSMFNDVVWIYIALVCMKYWFL
jgi:hypothetical protein